MLGKLKTGEKARIMNTAGTDRFVRRRLLDLGICEGSVICVKCILPFGGPVMVESCGQCIGIRRKEALRIEVEIL